MAKNSDVPNVIEQTIKLHLLEDLCPYQNNPRQHSDHQIDQIAQSIQSFGWMNPVLIDLKKQVIAGHGRLLAARRIGLKYVPTLQVDHLDEKQIRAYRIADNKISENSNWDDKLLGIELSELFDADLDFSLEVVGFEPPELDQLFGFGQSNEAPETAPTVSNAPAITQVGDLWEIGQHRILCANALHEASLDRLLDGDQAGAVFTDPPYNVPIAGHVSTKSASRHKEFVMASGELSIEEFGVFLETVCENTKAYLKPGAIAFVCMDWRHVSALASAGERAGFELKNICVWDKQVGGMGSLYRSRHEFVFVFKAPNGKHTNNVQLGRHGRDRTNVWTYAGVRSRPGDLALHPTVKPISMVADAILDVTRRGDIVLDPFLGSGTTILAAERTGRRGFGIELEPRYVDVAVKRIAAQTGAEPKRISLNESR